MKYTRSKSVIALFRFVVFLISTAATEVTFGQSTTSSFQLLYVRDQSNGVLEFVRSNNQGFTPLSLPGSPNCWAVSPDATYAAFTTENAQHRIVRIVNSLTFDAYMEFTWDTDWAFCQIYWTTDHILTFALEGVPNRYLNFDISQGTLVPVSFENSSPLPSLPEIYAQRTIRPWVLPSPQPNVFLYARCVGQQRLEDGTQNCPGGVQDTIYNTATNTVLGELPQSSAYSSGFDLYLEQHIGPERSAWSSDGRYIAYQSIRGESLNSFDLAVLDITTGTADTFEFEAVNQPIEYGIGLHWSPVSPVLAFWVDGLYCGCEAAMASDEVGLAFLNVASGTIIGADRSDHIRDLSSIHWSPDGTGLVYLNEHEELIYVDASTGVSTVLDTNVTEINGWIVNDT